MRNTLFRISFDAYTPDYFGSSEFSFKDTVNEQRGAGGVTHINEE